MSDLDSVRIGTERECAQYSSRGPLERAQDAQELATEVLDHVDHARPLLSALVRELRALGTEETKAALHLAEVARHWLSDDEHVAQESRLFACRRHRCRAGRRMHRAGQVPRRLELPHPLSVD